MDKTKKCRGCSRVFPQSGFYPQKKILKSGLSVVYAGTYCKDCKRIRRTEYYQKKKIQYRESRRAWAKENPKRIKELAYRFRTKLRLEVLLHYGGGKIECSCRRKELQQLLGFKLPNVRN